MSERLERNKQTAMAFYDLMFNQCKPREAIERYSGGQVLGTVLYSCIIRNGPPVEN